MERVEPGWAFSVLVCANQRAEGHVRGCCGRSDGDALRTWLRDRARSEGLRDALIVHRAGCMDVCGRGTTVALLGPNGRQVWSVERSDWEELWAEVQSTVTP